MIKVFGQTDKNFKSNGDVVLKPLRAKVRKEDNGSYYLDLETGLEYVDYLKEGNIVVANTPQGDQAFRITNPTKTRKKVTVKAYHVFYDSENYLIADSYVVDKNCNDALDHLNVATDSPSPFETLSDVQTVNSFRCVRKSLYEAVQTVLERWGGHLVRDNFRIEIRAEIGADNGVTVRYKKNLKEITCSENWDNVVTKLLPVGKDGILLNAIDRKADIYVYADKQYALPYTKTVSFNQDIDREDYDDDESYKQALVLDLRAKASEYVRTHSLPEVNYTLKANLDGINDIGDTVEVIDERLGLDLMTNVIAYDYDCLMRRFIEVEFGNFRKKLSQLLDLVNQSIDKTVSEAESNFAGDTDVKIEAVNQNIEEVNKALTDTINNTSKDLSDRITALSDQLYLEPGETMSINGVAVVGALRENQIIFSVSTPKKMPSAVTLTDLMLNLYNIDGTFCLPYADGGIDVLSDSDITVSGVIASENMLTVMLTHDGFSGTHNTPITAYIENIEISI